MIRVGRHARGIAVEPDDDADCNPETMQLEVSLKGYDAVISRGRLLVPISAAGALLNALGSDGVVWDEELLKAARRQVGHRQMQVAAREEVALALKNPREALKGYKRLHRLDVHQIEAVAAMVTPSLRGIAVFDEQGTGKTIMALAAFDWLRIHHKVDRLLVIAPKSVLAAWQVECRGFLGDQHRVILLSGSPAERRRGLLSPHDVVLVSYEAAVASKAILLTAVSATPGRYMLIIDESYFVKNAATARARLVRRLREPCERAVLLCGTPAPNSALDIINQIDIVDEGIAFAGRKIPKEPKAEYEEVAYALQDVIYLRRLKEQVLPSLPPKEIEKVYLDLTSRQRVLYDGACRELILQVREIDDRQFTRRLASFLAKRVRLLQICSNPRSVDPLYAEVPGKLLALDRLVHELLDEQEKKVVIWSYFRVSLDEIAARYRAYGLVKIDGTVVRIEDRLKAVEQFQCDPAIRVFVGNPAAAGAGITLTAAHHSVYESFSNQAAHYLQSIDRIHRRGQSQQTTAHILISRDTLEDREYERLIRKERMGRELLGDHYEELITRQRFLAELGG